jgi:branched-chain amino acid aminotransferase
MSKPWFTGENYDPDSQQATVNVFDHGLLYGDGVFEGIRTYNGRVFEREAHLRRFFDSAKAIRLTLPYTDEELSRALDDTLAANGLLTPERDSYIRLVATRGVGVLGISPLRTWRPQVIVIASTISMYPAEVYDKGMAIIISSVTRNHSNAMPPRIKSLNYLNNILGKLEAHDAGVPEAIMLNHLGYVAEATGDNVFIIRDGQIQTPPTSAGILEGITRATVMRLARHMGIEVVEKDLVRMDLYCCDEMFLTGTGAQVVPVTKIDNRVIGTGVPGPVTRELMVAYDKMVRSAPTEKSAAERGLTGVK